MLVVLRFSVGAEEEVSFVADARAAADLLGARPGCRSVRLARAVDDASAWTLVADWDNVGDYRRALSSYDIKAGAAMLLGRAEPGPSAFEVLYDAGAGLVDSDRAPDADYASRRTRFVDDDPSDG